MSTDAASDAHYDTIVIGAGQAGPGLAATLAGEGERVALVEQDRFGGTCLNSGCRPTKALRGTARAAHVARSSAGLGVHVDGVRVDLAEAIGRKDSLIDGWRASSVDWVEGAEGIDYLHGRARLVGTSDGSHHVDVDGRSLTARRVVLNTGARSVPPPIDGLDDVPWMDHHGILDVTELPSHLVVLGGSYIGLELGQVFSRFGARVTVVERGERVISREDAEVSEAVAAFLRDEGMTVLTGVEVDRVSRGGAGVLVALADGTELDASHVLVAAGRVPNSDDLGLDTVGVSTDDRGYVETDEVFATNVSGVYALGDVNGRGAFTHTSYQDGEILGDHLTGGSRTVGGRVMTYALFTDPPLGRVGASEDQLKRAGTPYRVSSTPMSGVTRAVLDGETDGLVKLLVGEDDQVLGAACLGIGGDELAQLFSLMMHAKVPVTEITTWLPIHPTVTEFLPTFVASLASPG
ncbi:mercuric reductase [Nocardioides sp. HDW12B]|uniref:mercuric reductase n=1 Tax=Nocardioides sp. HDW12B TaxID=2714939 RepID=UPI001408E4EB|nr:mercuric reductase [Nocardioides sp. HDW12B]QIK65021.1 mercuric reductase [Nocardioides sp. HDW12B]